MKLQFDSKVRVVALENLKAMCERVSGSHCHTFQVSKVSRSRVHVEYSNEDEWVVSHPMTAIYPCYPNGMDTDQDNPWVILDIMRVVNDSHDGEGWQSFGLLMDCPQLWRGESNEWSTREEIERAKRDATGQQA